MLALLRIDREALTATLNGTVFYRRRYRNVYRLAPIAQTTQTP